MDKFLVRFSILSLNAYIIVVLIFAFNGIDISIYDFFFSSTILFGILLTSLVHSQGKYHCKWIRALSYNTIFCPSVTYIDRVYDIFPEAIYYIYTICGTMVIVIAFTLILAINHFRRVRKVLKKNRYEELKPIKCNCTRKD